LALVLVLVVQVVPARVVDRALVSGLQVPEDTASRSMALQTRQGGRSLPFPFNWRVELHPILVHFPVALLSMALLFDVIGWARKSSSLRVAGLYCLAAGAVGTVLAVLSGRITPEANEREGGAAVAAPAIHLPDLAHFFSGRRVEVHEHWGYILLALVVLWVAARLAVALGKLRRPELAMVAGVLTFAVLLVTGYSGGALVYRERGRESGQVVPATAASIAPITRRSSSSGAASPTPEPWHQVAPAVARDGARR